MKSGRCQMALSQYLLYNHHAAFACAIACMWWVHACVGVLVPFPFFNVWIGKRPNRAGDQNGISIPATPLRRIDRDMPPGDRRTDHRPPCSLKI